MLDYIRNLTKSEDEKQQERLSAYLDGALTPEQQRQVESDLAQNDDQRSEFEQMSLLRQQMRQLPQRQVRRNFILDPALYGRPRREPLVQAYPALRTATALAAFFFIFALAANLFLNGTTGTMSSVQPIAMQAVSGENMALEAVVEESEAAAVMMSTESVDDAAEGAAAAVLMDEVKEEQAAAERVDEPVEEPLFADEVASGPELEASRAEPGAALAPLERESAVGAAMESPAAAEESTAASPGEDAAVEVLPTMPIEGPAEEAMASEPQALPLIAVPEPAIQTEESGALEVIGSGEDAAPSIEKIQPQRDQGSFWVNQMGLIVLLLGLSFVILIVLTLLARRRL